MDQRILTVSWDDVQERSGFYVQEGDNKRRIIFANSFSFTRAKYDKTYNFEISIVYLDQITKPTKQKCFMESRRDFENRGSSKVALVEVQSKAIKDRIASENKKAITHEDHRDVVRNKEGSDPENHTPRTSHFDNRTHPFHGPDDLIDVPHAGPVIKPEEIIIHPGSTHRGPPGAPEQKTIPKEEKCQNSFS